MTGIKTTQFPSVAGKKGFSLISDEKFRQLYAALLKCRMLDERLQSSPDYDSWLGREAASAAVTACLRRTDSVVPTPRGLLARYLHDGSLTIAPPSSDPALQFTASNQAALRHKLEKPGGIAVVFTRSAETAGMREAFASASKQSLPVLYVLEGGTPPSEICAGIPVIRVDGSDIVALYRVAYESIVRAREGTGPTIIECAVWPADPQPSDPLVKFEQYLTRKKLFRPHWKRQLEKKFAGAVDEAIGFIPGQL